MAKLAPRAMVPLAAYARHLARRSEPGYATSLDAERGQFERATELPALSFVGWPGEYDRAGL